MAFTDSQVVQIKVYLGYPQDFANDMYYLDSALARIGADALKQAQVEAWLGQLVTLDTQLLEAITAAGIKKADEVEFFNASGQTAGYIMQGKRVINRMSLMFQVPINGDYYGTLGYSGSLSGNTIPLG